MGGASPYLQLLSRWSNTTGICPLTRFLPIFETITKDSEVFQELRKDSTNGTIDGLTAQSILHKGTHIKATELPVTAARVYSLNPPPTNNSLSPLIDFVDSQAPSNVRRRRQHPLSRRCQCLRRGSFVPGTSSSVDRMKDVGDGIQSGKKKRTLHRRPSN